MYVCDWNECLCVVYIGCICAVWGVCGMYVCVCACVCVCVCGIHVVCPCDVCVESVVYV